MFALFENLTNWLWGLPLLITILVTGIYLTIRSGFFQFRHFGHIVKNMFSKERREEGGDDGKSLTPFQAISIAIGGTVGVSNMSGVATAIATGGPGALFWLWVAALLAMVIKMTEVTLAVYYREKQPNGEYLGGPTYYMQKGLGGEKKLPFWKIFAVLFGGCIFMTWFITLQNYTVSEAVGSTFKLPYIVPSLLYVLAIYVIIIGGVKKVGVISSYMTPVMCLLYIVGSLFILITNYERLPEAFVLIFKGAFTTQAAVGGFLGAGVATAMRLGFARSVYSNEAGWGTSPMIHASAKTDHPVKQGLMGAFEVFADTIVVCSMTGLVVIVTGYWNSGLQGSELTLTAFESGMGSVARALIALSIFLFGLTTNRLVYILQCYPETLAEKQSESVQNRRKSIYSRNTIMGTSGYRTDTLRKRNSGTALGYCRLYDGIPDICKRSNIIYLKRNLYQTVKRLQGTLPWYWKSRRRYGSFL